MVLNDFLQACKEELQPLCSLGNGGSWLKMVDFLYKIRTVRYITYKQIMVLGDTDHPNGEKFKPIRKRADDLAKIGYLYKFVHNETGAGVYRATQKTTDLLKSLNFNITLLQPEPTGDGGVDSISKTDVFIQALKLPNFKALLFPRFPKDTPYLIPDALLVEAESDIKYRLSFLEVETEKPDWDNYLENKKYNYERLGKDDQVYRYWENVSEHLGLKKPTKEQFKFCVVCHGKIKKEWRGWEFRKEIY